MPVTTCLTVGAASWDLGRRPRHLHGNPPRGQASSQRGGPALRERRFLLCPRLGGRTLSISRKHEGLVPGTLLPESGKILEKPVNPHTAVAVVENASQIVNKYMIRPVVIKQWNEMRQRKKTQVHQVIFSGTGAQEAPKATRSRKPAEARLAAGGPLGSACSWRRNHDLAVVMGASLNSALVSSQYCDLYACLRATISF